MILQDLWGLLLLLSIPVLIIIYIIKQDHKERAVSSTYLWHLSERFLKKRLPIKRMTSLLAFLLQLAILALLTFSATRPAMALGQISGHIVIIDASASMQTEQDGVSRFDAAVAEVKALAESGLCSSMTVIFASDTPSCPVMGGNISEAVNVLNSAECGYGGCDLYEAMKLTREAYARMGSAKVTFYTDTTYEDVENVEVVNMHRDEKNVAITSLTHLSGDFTGTLVSYGEDREVTVGLYVDDTIVDTQIVSCVNGEPTEVGFDANVSAFEKATLRFELEDALELDNSYSVMGKRSETMSVLVVGKETLFFETGLNALGNCDVTVKNQYKSSDDGAYDLYIFSGCIGEKDNFPQNGMTVGFTQFDTSLTKLLGNMTVYPSSGYGTGLSIYYGNLLESDPLLSGMETALEDVYIRNMLGCWELDYRWSLRPVLDETFTWEPLCEVGSDRQSEIAACKRILDNGNRQYLFFFPISETNLAMTPAFMLLLQNACNLASAPSIPKTQYAVGETVEITLKKDAEAPVIHTPDEKVTELMENAPAFIPTAPGIHTLTYEYNKQTREASFFVHIPVEEYETYSVETIFLSKSFERNGAGEMLSSTMLPLIAVILSALLIFEWGYHYRGKY